MHKNHMNRHIVRVHHWKHGHLVVTDYIALNFLAALALIATLVFESFKIFDCDDNLVHCGPGTTDGDSCY